MNLSLAQCRQHLGKAADGLTDDEVVEIRNALDMFADVLIASFLQSNSRPKNDATELAE